MKKTLIACLAIFCLLMACKEDEPSTEGPENTNEEFEGTLSVSPTIKEISQTAGTTYISVTSNTDWTVYPNNSSNAINDLEVTPLEGAEDGTVKIEFGTAPSYNYLAQSATIVFYYYSFGVKQYKTCQIYRNSPQNP